MNNEQEIERIVKVLEKATQPIEYDENCCTITTYPTERDIAESLVDAGIGDKKQAVKEAFDMLKKRVRYKLQGHPIVFEEDIDELFTELYGADE